MKKEFLGQREGEEVKLVFRRHPIVMTKGIFIFILLAIIGFLPYIIAPDSAKLLFIAVAGILVGLIVFFYYWIGWYFSVFILTDQRIRQNTQKGLFRKSVVDLELNNISSSFVDIKGFWASIFKYGSIVIRTKAGDMYIKKIASVESVYDKIQEAITKVGYEEQQ